LAGSIVKRFLFVFLQSRNWPYLPYGNLSTEREGSTKRKP